MSKAQEEKAARIDLGLAIAEHHAARGVPMTCDVLAAFCGCSRSRIYFLERDALKKLRNRLRFMKDERLRELCEEVFSQARRRDRANTPARIFERRAA